MPRPLSKDQRHLTFSLLHWFGAAGERQSAAAIAAKLPLIDQRTPRTKEIVASTMEDLVVHGWAVPAAGPRGGTGWVLSDAGTALLARVAEVFMSAGHHNGYASVFGRRSLPTSRTADKSRRLPIDSDGFPLVAFHPEDG